MASPPKTIGLIAGSGGLPLYFAREARARGYSVRTAAILGAASKRLASFSDGIQWITIGQIGKLLSFFRASGVRRAVLHGKIQHSTLLKNPRLDFKALSLLARTPDRSGASLLRALAGELARHQIRVLDARFLMEGLLAPPGCLTSVQPGSSDRQNAVFGLAKARALARLGVGQTVAVKKRAVVAVEGVEGTDEAILRAGKWAGPGVVVAKAAGPRQDWRFDVPTVGLQTLKTMARARAAGLVLESGRVFLLDREKALAFARKRGIFVTAEP